MACKGKLISPTGQQSTDINSIMHQFQITSLDPEKIPSLPQEILVEILTRLPVKSLLKFRSISKSWLSLISSPNFIKTHLQNSTNKKGIIHHRILATIYDKLDCLLIDCYLHPLLFNSNSDTIKIDRVKKFPLNSVQVVGSCNGLVCISICGKQFVLWNPTTRKSKQLPVSGMELKSDRLLRYGFGFDEANDDYKVVEISCGDEEAIVRVYSLRSDSWKRIADFEGKFGSDSGAYINGKLHWLRRLPDCYTSGYDIVSLDIKTDMYGRIELFKCHSESTLCVLRGCLSVLESRWTHGDLWIWKEYGVKASWTKMASIPYIDDPTDYLDLRPIYVLNNGQVLLSFGTFFGVYNPKDKSLIYPTIDNFNICHDGAHIYVESLVSPIADDGLRGK